MRILPDGTKEKIEGTEMIRSIYFNEYVSHNMSCKFAKVVWLQFTAKRIDYFKIPSLEAKRCFYETSFTYCIVSCSEKSPSAATEDGLYSSDNSIGLAIEILRAL